MTENEMPPKGKKFEKLANDRMDKAIRMLRRIGNLSNKNAYEYNDQQVSKMLRALRSEVKAINEKFNSATNGNSEKKEQLFKL